MNHSLFRLFVVSCLFLSPVFAEDESSSKIFVFEKKELESLLPGPWKEGTSVEGDLVLEIQRQANEKQIEAALAEDSFDLWCFNDVLGKNFDKAKLPETAKEFEEISKNVSKTTSFLKDKYQRNRPYQGDERVKTKAPPRSLSASYPSGHATHGMFWGMLLSEFRPDLREALLSRGREIGWHRIALGVHYPSDTQAGFYLGQTVARRYLASPEFKSIKAKLIPEWRKAGLMNVSKTSSTQ